MNTQAKAVQAARLVPAPLRRRTLLHTAALPGLVGFLLAAPAFAQSSPASDTPRWRSDIAPIVYRSCTGCHHAGGSGPFPLTTYAEVKRFLSVIDTATSTRYMPPWLPEPGHGSFAETRRLPDEDLARLSRWIKAGAPEGSGAVPPPPVYTSEWQLGKPDLVLEMADPVNLAAGGSDQFLNVILSNPLHGTHWVRAMEIKPGAPRVVHHANVLLDRTGSVRRTHPDWKRGIPGMDLDLDAGDAFDPDSHFLFWKPDSTALVEPAGMPWRLDEGNDLVLNLHLKPSGRPESTRARIALYFTAEPATRHPLLVQLEHDAALDLAPGEAAHVVEDELTLPVEVAVLGVYPHAHYLARRMEAWATLPGGERRDLILIEDWDIDRQSVYRLAEPMRLAAGSTVHMRYTYDNSAANPRNPHAPPVRVRAGNRSEDEMAHLWLQVVPLPPAAAGTGGDQGWTELHAQQEIERAWMNAMLRKNPDDALALYNVASLSLAGGDAPGAIERLKRLLDRTPKDPRALTAMGAAYVVEQKDREAEAQFEAALEADPHFTDAAFNLASLEMKAGRLKEAEAHLTQCANVRADDTETHHRLGLVLAEEGKLPEAAAELRLWAKLAPADPEAPRALSEVLGQMGDRAGAMIAQQRAIALGPATAGDWNNLGVLHARAGDRAAAHADFERALELDPALDEARANLKRLDEPRAP